MVLTDNPENASSRRNSDGCVNAFCYKALAERAGNLRSEAQVRSVRIPRPCPGATSSLDRDTAVRKETTRPGGLLCCWRNQDGKATPLLASRSSAGGRRGIC